ncbi:arylsulfatase [Paraburkholderia sp. RCC_158]|uniref:arylsulfatase n=1 Tax=Paraburkholderia sp. RCC_158 TaxID=3239220 RepID=UPI0035247FBB
MRISFLHTINDNKRIFEDAAIDLGLRTDNLRHEVRSDLREAVQQAGAFPASVKQETKRCLLALASDADAVILTCATLGPAVEGIESTSVPIVRADVALAAAAGKIGGKTAVLCAVEASVEPTRRLFARYASHSVTSVDVIHVERVWTLFQNGDVDECFAAIAASADQAYEEGATLVAYAHPWMAPAVNLARRGRQPLHSPQAALRAVMQRGGDPSLGF